MRRDKGQRDGEPLPGAEKNGGDDATEAGGGNLHRGRGATAWGREEGGDDATEVSCLGLRCGIKNTERTGATAQESVDGAEPLPGPKTASHCSG